MAMLVYQRVHFLQSEAPIDEIAELVKITPITITMVYVVW